MSGQDAINPQRARQYAWRHAESETSLGEESDGRDFESEATDASSESTERSQKPRPDWRHAAMAAAATLDEETERIWAISNPAAQCRAAVGLFRSVTEPRTMAALSIGNPLGAMRLLRLAHRHYRALGDEAGGIMRRLCFFARFHDPEAAELFLDIARSGDRRFMRWLEFPLSASLRSPDHWKFLRQTQLCVRLCALLDEEFPWASRELALDFLFLCCTKEALPTLRRALRLPHLGIRWRAVTLLVRAFTPPALEASELLFLVHDLFEHPPVFQGREPPFWAKEEVGYVDGLTEALQKLRPAEAVIPILRILTGDHLSRALARSESDADWVLKTLAAAYPSDALPHIDRYFCKSRSWARRTAVEAAACLPAEEARPRLLRAASDGAPHVAERARSLLEECFGVACPVQPLDGIATDLLEMPPSESFLPRLEVLRNPSEEVRQTMLEALLNEAPDREALALILYALADDGLLLKRHRPKLPKDRRALHAQLYRRFGPPALHALCLLADRYPEPNGSGGLLDLLYLVQTVRLPKRDAALLRALALRRLQIETFEARQSALMLLTRIGVPDELYPQLLHWVQNNAEAWIFAADVLASAPRNRARAEALAGHLLAAFQAGNGELLIRLSCAISKRPSPRLLSVAERLISEWIALPEPAADSPDAERSRYAGAAMKTAMLELSRRLRATGKLTLEWIKESLGSPASRAFLIAVNLVQTDEYDEEVLDAMRKALDSDAQGGVAALEAAVNLLSHGKGISADDPRFLRLAKSARGEWRGRMLFMMLAAGASIEPLRSTIAESLCAADREEAESMDSVVEHYAKPFGLAELAALLPKVRAPQLATIINAVLDAKKDPRAYWQDSEIVLDDSDD